MSGVQPPGRAGGVAPRKPPRPWAQARGSLDTLTRGLSVSLRATVGIPGGGVWAGPRGVCPSGGANGPGLGSVLCPETDAHLPYPCEALSFVPPPRELRREGDGAACPASKGEPSPGRSGSPLPSCDRSLRPSASQPIAATTVPAPQTAPCRGSTLRGPAGLAPSQAVARAPVAVVWVAPGPTSWGRCRPDAAAPLSCPLLLPRPRGADQR